MSDRKGHRGRFRMAEGTFRTTERSVSTLFHRGAMGCSRSHWDLHALGQALGKLQEHYEEWVASGETDQRALDDGRKVVYMAEQTVHSLRAKMKARCIKAI